MFVDKEQSERAPGSLGRNAPLMKVFGEAGEEKDDIISEPSSMFNRSELGRVKDYSPTRLGSAVLQLKPS